MLRNMKRIGTHSGTFHHDEALGCFLLKHTAQFKDVSSFGPSFYLLVNAGAF